MTPGQMLIVGGHFLFPNTIASIEPNYLYANPGLANATDTTLSKGAGTAGIVRVWLDPRAIGQVYPGQRSLPAYIDVTDGGEMQYFRNLLLGWAHGGDAVNATGTGFGAGTGTLTGTGTGTGGGGGTGGPEPQPATTRRRPAPSAAVRKRIAAGVKRAAANRQAAGQGTGGGGGATGTETGTEDGAGQTAPQTTGTRATRTSRAKTRSAAGGGS